MLLMTILAVCLSMVAHAAPFLYCSEQNIEVADGAIRLERQWDVVFADRFDDGIGAWAVDNYKNKLAIGPDPAGRTGACLLVTNHGAKGDTAFEVRSAPRPVTGGAPFRFSFAWRANRPLAALAGHKGKYMTQLQWLDAAREALDPLPFTFAKAVKEWQTKELVGTVPDAAVAVVIRFGCDHPNIEHNEFLALDDVRFEMHAEPARFASSGHVLSRPLLAPGQRRMLSWTADVPPDASVRFRVASATDDHGTPAAWSEPLGPDGSADSYFEKPAPLPAPHAGRPWLRYIAVLETNDVAKSPVLRSVSLGGGTDGPWAGRDTAPPAVTERSPTRTGDVNAPIRFRLSDETGVDLRTLRVTLDEANVTDRLSSANGVFTYRPPHAWTPPPLLTGMSRWRVSNYRGRLTIERSIRRTPDSPPGFHVTREAGQTDTAFCLKSPPIPVQAGASYRLSYWSRHSMPLRGAMNSKRSYAGGVTWLDEKGNQVGDRAQIDFGAANVEWHQDSDELTAPAGATNAWIAFGFDTPNIVDGGFVDIAEALLDGPHPNRADDRPNLHRIHVRVADFAGNQLSRKWFFLIRSPRTENVVTLRDDGTVLIDAKPFFPIGLYSVWKKEFNNNSFDKAFGALATAGFNLAHTYNSKRSPDFAEFYGAAARHGIKLYVASDAGANCTEVDTVLWDVIREEHQPALLAWYLADDTAGHVGHADLRTLSEAIHDVDPAHPTVQADAVGAPPVSRYTQYVASTDGFLPELYPIRDNSDRGVPRIIADMKTVQTDLEKASTRRKTVWAIIQYFQGWGWPRYPTRDELWAMSYLSIIHGANGITWYTYGGWGENHGVTDSPDKWKNICELAGELARLQDVFVERTGPQPPAPMILDGPETDALGFPSISVLQKEHAGKVHLFAANSAKADVTARFRIPDSGAVTVPFEKRELTGDRQGFTDTFGPYAVHVYRLTR